MKAISTGGTGLRRWLNMSGCAIYVNSVVALMMQIYRIKNHFAQPQYHQVFSGLLEIFMYIRDIFSIASSMKEHGCLVKRKLSAIILFNIC